MTRRGCEVVNESTTAAYSMLDHSAHLGDAQQMAVVMSRMEEMNITLKMLMHGDEEGSGRWR